MAARVVAMTRWQAFRDLPWRARAAVVLAVFPLLHAWICVKVSRER